MRETVVRFGERQSLVGIVADPGPDMARRRAPAVLLLNAGILHSAGPSCLYVTLARRLAAAGHVVLRFDFAGIGDSAARQDGLSFEQGVLIEARQAMDLITATHGIDRFVTTGICSGAVNAFRVACDDARVVGAALLNPQGYFASSAKRIDSYVRAEKDKQYLLRIALRRRASWLKLLRGEVDHRALVQALSSRLLRPFAERGAERGDIAALAGNFAALVQRGASLLHVYAEADPGLIEFDLVARGLPASLRGGMRPVIVAGSDHLFTPLHAQRMLTELVLEWIAIRPTRNALPDPAAPTISEAAHAWSG